MHTSCSVAMATWLVVEEDGGEESPGGPEAPGRAQKLSPRAGCRDAIALVTCIFHGDLSLPSLRVMAKQQCGGAHPKLSCFVSPSSLLAYTRALTAQCLLPCSPHLGVLDAPHRLCPQV